MRELAYRENIPEMMQLSKQKEREKAREIKENEKRKQLSKVTRAIEEFH